MNGKRTKHECFCLFDEVHLNQLEERKDWNLVMHTKKKATNHPIKWIKYHLHSHFSNYTRIYLKSKALSIAKKFSAWTVAVEEKDENLFTYLIFGVSGGVLTIAWRIWSMNPTIAHSVISPCSVQPILFWIKDDHLYIHFLAFSRRKTMERKAYSEGHIDFSFGVKAKEKHVFCFFLFFFFHIARVPLKRIKSDQIDY